MKGEFYSLAQLRLNEEKSCFFLIILAPAANPTYIWLTTSIKNGQIPANPPIIVNGTVTVVEGGIHLDGITGSLDAGEVQENG